VASEGKWSWPDFGECCVRNRRPGTMVRYNSNGLRVAIDGTPLIVPTGGIRRYVEELTAALRQHFPEDDYPIISDQLSPPRWPLERRWWLWGVRREMERRGADLFHGTDFSVPYLPSRPSVMTVHDLSPWRPEGTSEASRRVRFRTPLLLRMGLAKMVITPSEAIRREVIGRFHLAPDRVIAVPLAASLHFRPVETQRNRRPYLLYVGTIEPRKNLTRVIEAWKEVRKRAEVDLVLVGRVRTQVDCGSATLIGAVPDSDLPALYSGAVAAVYPSVYEGFGLPVLEAMQCGTMVIASRDPAITELAGGAALQVDAGDGAGWVEAMMSALNAEFRAGWCEAGRRRAAEFSWERTARMTREVYGEALRRS